jgi:predicted branched-subunit amino acid permease
MSTTDLDRPPPVAQHARRGPDRDALRDIWPMALGVVPFGLLIGVTVGRMHLGAALGLGSAALYFGGSGHLAALTMLAEGAGPLAVLATVAVVNCRLALYAAALAPRFADQPAWFRWLAPQVLVDQIHAVATARPDLAGAAFRRYWATAGSAFALCWLGSNAAGVLLGPVLSEHSPLEIAVPAMFVGLLTPQLVRRPAAVAAGVGGTVAAVSSVLPQGTGLLLGALAGVVAGTLADRARGEGASAEDRP